ncbi:hypothetical protein JD79_00948 [Geodermatophilus normandii]|uniref:DUF7402 domain-containing protein n=1 Tax=Geodermatophilus normandii TaxID=1137989 RepID=A0A317QGA9_9ACTN|nr:hypothetical protein JD79_00948 [Geodermatophilus normandii]
MVDGYPGTATAEWAAVGGRTDSWLQLTWPGAVTVGRVVLHDRPNTSDRITSTTLTFSDGSTVTVPALADTGSAVTVRFTPRATTSVRLTVTGVSSTTVNVGPAELDVWNR